MERGYIKLWRCLQDSKLWESKREPFSRGQAWVDLLMLANYADREVLLRGKPVVIKRGQVARSEVFLASRWRWSRNKLRRFIRVLETIQQVEQQTNNVTSVITILNYDMYQGSDTANETASGTAPGTPGDTAKEESKKVRKKESILGEVTSKTIPPPIGSVVDYCRERNNGIDAQTFVDYYQRQGWKLKNGVKMTDWQAAVRTWERNRKGNETNGKPKSKLKQFAIPPRPLFPEEDPADRLGHGIPPSVGTPEAGGVGADSAERTDGSEPR